MEKKTSNKETEEVVPSQPQQVQQGGEELDPEVDGVEERQRLHLRMRLRSMALQEEYQNSYKQQNLTQNE